MEICDHCEKQVKKSHRAKPHDWLKPFGDVRIFKGSQSRGYEEHDYQCLTCSAKFTRSTDKNNLPWTLWQG